MSALSIFVHRPAEYPLKAFSLAVRPDEALILFQSTNLQTYQYDSHAAPSPLISCLKVINRLYPLADFDRITDAFLYLPQISIGKGRFI